MKVILSSVFLVLFSFVFAQKYDRTYLENQNKQLKKEIAELNSFLAKSKADSKSSFLYITALNQKIASREKLVNNMNREKRFVEDDIYNKQLEVNKLNRELSDMRKSYGEVLVKAYKNKSVQNKILFILSAKDMSQTFRRIKYLQLYAEYQEKKAGDIQAKISKLEQVRNQKEKAVQDKKILLAQQTVDLQKLDTERDEKTVAVEKFRREQGDYIAKIKLKQAQEKKNQDVINKLISDEIAAIKAREKAEKDALVLKAKKEKEEKDRLAKLEEEQRKKAREAQLAVERSAAAEKAALEKKAKEEKEKLLLAQRQTQQAQEKLDKATETKSDVLSNSFAENKGRMPMPVVGRIVVPYGNSTNPITGNPSNNVGIDIMVTGEPKAKSIFDGEVRAVTNIDGNYAIIVSHGEYFSAYSNIDDVYVKKGQKIKKGESIGHVYTNTDNETILKLSIHKGKEHVNPSAWVN